MRQLGAQDAMFLYTESGHQLAHATACQVFDPSTAPKGVRTDLSGLIKHVDARIGAAPLLKWRLSRVPLELDLPYWVDDEHFDIEHHIRQERLSGRGDWQQFCDFLARYHSRPLDMQRPLWEMLLIDGLDNIAGLPKGAFAVATKLHHAAVDGTSAMRFLAAIMDIDPNGTRAIPIESAPVERVADPKIPVVLIRAVKNNFGSPLRLVSSIVRSIPSPAALAMKVVSNKLLTRSDAVPDTRFNRKVSPRRVFDSVTFSLEEISGLRACVPGSTVNDVILAICSGALRKYLQHHDELPDAPLVAWVPINARPKDSNSSDNAGNNLAAMTVPLHTNLDDSLARLSAVQRSTRKSKAAKTGSSARLLTDLSKHVPTMSLFYASRMLVLASQLTRVCNVFISNIPGPQQQLYMNGARCDSFHGLAPIGDGMGLFIGTPSYNGQVFFDVTSTREILPDIDFLKSCLIASMQDLLESE